MWSGAKCRIRGSSTRAWWSPPGICRCLLFRRTCLKYDIVARAGFTTLSKYIHTTSIQNLYYFCNYYCTWAKRCWPRSLSPREMFLSILSVREQKRSILILSRLSRIADNLTPTWHRHDAVAYCIILPQQHSCRKVGFIELRVESYPRLVPRPDHQKHDYDDVHKSA